MHKASLTIFNQSLPFQIPSISDAPEKNYPSLSKLSSKLILYNTDGILLNLFCTLYKTSTSFMYWANQNYTLQMLQIWPNQSFIKLQHYLLALIFNAPGVVMVKYWNFNARW